MPKTMRVMLTAVLWLGGFLLTAPPALGAWVDDPVVSSATRVRRAHLIELITQIDAARAASGCLGVTAPFNYAGELAGNGTNRPQLVAGTTPIRASHFSQLKGAIQAVYTATGDDFTPYDFNPQPGQLVRAVHLQRLRSAVDNAGTCAAGPICGNGAIEPGEQCDDGNAVDNDFCTNACQSPRCGDMIVQAALAEECEDGNMINTDSCSNTCKLSNACSSPCEMGCNCFAPYQCCPNNSCSITCSNCSKGPSGNCPDPNVCCNDTCVPQTDPSCGGTNCTQCTNGTCVPQGQTCPNPCATTCQMGTNCFAPNACVPDGNGCTTCGQITCASACEMGCNCFAPNQCCPDNSCRSACTQNTECTMGVNCFAPAQCCPDGTCRGAGIPCGSGVDCAAAGGSGTFGDNCQVCNAACATECAPSGSWNCFNCVGSPPSCPSTCTMGLNCFAPNSCCSASDPSGAGCLADCGVVPTCGSVGGSGIYGDGCYNCNSACPSECAAGSWDCFNCDATPPLCPPIDPGNPPDPSGGGGGAAPGGGCIQPPSCGGSCGGQCVCTGSNICGDTPFGCVCYDTNTGCAQSNPSCHTCSCNCPVGERCAESPFSTDTGPCACVEDNVPTCPTCGPCQQCSVVGNTASCQTIQGCVGS